MIAAFGPLTSLRQRTPRSRSRPARISTMPSWRPPRASPRPQKKRPASAGLSPLRAARRAGRPVKLTALEFRLLAVLLANAGTLLAKNAERYLKPAHEMARLYA